MLKIKVRIERFTDDTFPGWVECRLVDATGVQHLFEEKVPVVTTEKIHAGGAFPSDGVIQCSVISTRYSPDNQELVTIDTNSPWGIESKTGQTRFEVFRDQLLEIDESAGRVTHRVVLQRIRNRMIEYLELASSFDDQRDYQSRAPVHVPNEIINRWEDYVNDPCDPAFTTPTFSDAERVAIAKFHDTWDDVADATPEPLPDLDTLFGTREWKRLRDAAFESLQVFLRRGKLSEAEEEIQDQ